MTAGTQAHRIAARLRGRLRALAGRALGGGDDAMAARMSLVTFAVRIASAAIAFASQIVLARWMGGFEYGVFVFVWTAILILGNLSCLGFGTSVVRFIPEYLGRRSPRELRGILFASRIVVLGASTLIAAIGALALALLSGSLAPHYVAPLLLGMVCVPMMALSDLFHGVARGHGWSLRAMLPTFVLRPLLLIALTVAAIWSGAAPTAQTAMYAAIAATYATTLYQIATVSWPVDRDLRHADRQVAMRGWVLVSMPVFLVEGFIYLIVNADVLLVGVFLGPEDTGIYFATVKTLALVHFVYFAVKAGVSPRFAALMHGERRDELTRFARTTVRWTFWPTLAMGLAILALGEPILALFGAGFTTGYPLLFVLVAGVVARASVGPAEALLTMGGFQNVCARLYAGVLVFAVGAGCILVPLYGLWGAAVATASTMALEAALLGFAVRHWLGFGMWIAARPDTAGATS